jgi:hypothetical protein
MRLGVLFSIIRGLLTYICNMSLCVDHTEPMIKVHGSLVDTCTGRDATGGR